MCDERELRRALRELQCRCLTPAEEKFCRQAEDWIGTLPEELRIDAAELMNRRLEVEQLRTKTFETLIARERARPLLDDLVAKPELRQRGSRPREVARDLPEELWVEDKLDTLLKKLWPSRPKPAPDQRLLEELSEEAKEMIKHLAEAERRVADAILEFKSRLASYR